MTTTSNCSICCETYNKSKCFKIQCMYCDFEACRTCCEKYVVSENIPKCMNHQCNREWSLKFMRQNFTNVFLTSSYKSHVEDVLFDQQKALLPATQGLVEERIRKNKIRAEIKEIDQTISNLITHRRELERQANWNASKLERMNFVRQCPANDCRGFLSSQWKCGICEKWTCPTCHELKGDQRDCEHTCKSENIETAKLLEKDSKPCPQCQSLIFKIDGCNQMWCTQCHTGFDWRTGRVEKHVHNPHYFEWQRQNNGGVAPRDQHDVECGRIIDHNLVHQVYSLARTNVELFKVCDENTTTSGKKIVYRTRNEPRYIYVDSIGIICECIRHSIHNREVELMRVFQLPNYVQMHEQNRVGYLEGTISEAIFKKWIHRDHKKHNKYTEISQVLRLQQVVFTDILFVLLQSMQEHILNFYVHYHIFESALNELVSYCNKLFSEIGFTYNSNTYYMFDKHLEFKRFTKKEWMEFNSQGASAPIATEQTKEGVH